MRILSQNNGKYDLPYENIVLEKMMDCNTIYAYTGTGQPFKMAVYSSGERMRKAMEMLHEAYTGVPLILQNVDISDETMEMFEKWKRQGICVVSENQPSKVEYVGNVLFQFPDDDEVEVGR